MRLIQLSDIHLLAQPGASLRGVKTDQTIQKVINSINRLKTAADVVIITGDLVVNQSGRAYDRLRPMLQQLKIPVYVLPGNHDDVDAIHNILCGENIYSPSLVDFKGWCFIFVNTKLDNQRYGFVNTKELTLLQKNLKSSNNNPTIIALHHPPVQQCPLPGCQLQNGEQVMSLLEKYENIRAILAGHTHMANESTHQHIRQFVAPSTFSQAVHGNWQGGETTETVLQNHWLDNSKQGFRILDIHSDGKIESEVVWI